MVQSHLSDISWASDQQRSVLLYFFFFFFFSVFLLLLLLRWWSYFFSLDIFSLYIVLCNLWGCITLHIEIPKSFERRAIIWSFYIKCHQFVLHIDLLETLHHFIAPDIDHFEILIHWKMCVGQIYVYDGLNKKVSYSSYRCDLARVDMALFEEVCYCGIWFQVSQVHAMFPSLPADLNVTLSYCHCHEGHHALTMSLQGS